MQRMISEPLVSVIMATYNMESYVKSAIASILNQTYKNIELIIVDDGSKDQTVKIIESFNDDRIKLHIQENSGPSRAYNKALSLSRGEYVAILSGDDVSTSDRIAVELQECLNDMEKIIFSKVEIIDEDGKPNNHTWAQGLFDAVNMSTPEILERLVMVGNYFNASTHFSSRRLLDKFCVKNELGPFDPNYIQLQDFDLWIRMAQSGVEFKVIEDRLVYYRVKLRGKNLSFPSKESKRRTDFELYLIAENIFSNTEKNIFESAFAKYFNQIYFNSELEQRIEKSLLLIKSKIPSYRLVGLKILNHILGNSEEANVLKNSYKIDSNYFSNHVCGLDVFYDETSGKDKQVFMSRLYVNDSTGYREETAIKKIISRLDTKFELEFDLRYLKKVYGLRFDPYEGSLKLLIKINAFLVFDEKGVASDCIEKLVCANGIPTYNKFYLFKTEDPQFEYSCKNKISKVVIKGEFSDEAI